jgi:hypothetical protein
MGRIANAVSRPGIDPRIWCSLAFALDESMLDKDHGDFVDVALLPTELEVTVRVPQSYAGKAFGVNEGRIHKDDELVVLFPDGDPASGGIVVARLWSASDLPPQDAIDNPKDFIRVMEDGLSWLVKLQGSDGKASLEADNVRLGRDAQQALLLGNEYRTADTTKHTADQAALVNMTAAAASLLAAAPFLLIPISGPVLASPLILAAGTSLSAAAAQLTAAITQFETSSDNYLSAVSKTK